MNGLDIEKYEAIKKTAEDLGLIVEPYHSNKIYLVGIKGDKSFGPFDSVNQIGIFLDGYDTPINDWDDGATTPDMLRHIDKKISTLITERK